MINELRIGEMPIHYLSRVNRIMSSGGNQIKWVQNNVFYKLDLLGYESIAERLTTVLLKHSYFRDGSM